MRNFTRDLSILAYRKGSPQREEKVISTNGYFLNLNFSTCVGALLFMLSASVGGAQAQDSLGVQQGTDSVRIVAPVGSVVVKGVVTDASTDNPLAGITLAIEGYSSAISDDKGEFVIYVPSYTATLVATGADYHNKEIPLKGRQNVSVQLHESKFRSIYGTSTIVNNQKPLTHTVNAVVSTNLVDKFQSSAETSENYLQGKVAGLNMTRRSGIPGVGTFMSLRGFNSLYATNQPLVVVDGMIYDMNDYGGSLIQNHFSNPLAFIDPKDIDNITVVKDATSQFGSKGGNGAIFITTTHAQELATRIDFSVYTGFNSTPSKYPVMDAAGHRGYVSDILRSAGYSDSYVQSQPYMNDDPSSPGYYTYHNNTDWQDKTFKSSYNQNYYVRVTGGDNIAKYALMMGTTDHKGVINDTWMKRYNMRFNADLNITQRITANTNLSFSYSENKLVETGLTNKTNPVFLSLVKSPLANTNFISEEGLTSPNLSEVDIFNIGNPSAIVSNMKATNKLYRFFGTINFNYKLNDAFKVSNLFGVTTDKIRENLFIPEKGVIPDTLYNALAKNRMGAQLQRSFMIYDDIRLSFDKILDNKHTFSAKAGMRFISSKSEEDYGLGFNSATDDLITIGTGTNTLRQVGGTLGKWVWINYYATADYNLRSKYFLTFNLALDGSSRFGKEASDGIKLYDNSFGVFPSLGAAWLISSENFMASAKGIELLKLRVNYGLTGNDDIGNYSTKEFYTSQSFLGRQGLVKGGVANPNLQWETIQKLNAGLDVSFLNERLSLSFDVFKNTTTDMLTIQPLDAVSGFNYMLTNGGSMENKGVEAALNARLIDKAIRLDIGLNLATYRNQVTMLPVNDLETHYAGATILTRVGQSVGVFYGQKTNGVYTSDEEASNEGLQTMDAHGNLVAFRGGDVRFVDVDGDQVIDDGDRQIIGNPNPDFTGMFNTRIGWRRFTIDASFTLSYGNDVYNYTRSKLESMSGYENQTERVVNRWRTNGQVTNMPRAEFGDPMGNARFSDRWIEDGSYLRLRTVSLTYDLPIHSTYFKYVTLYATGNNLLTFSKYLGYDPEFSASNNVLFQGIDTGLMPQYKSFLIGVRVGL